MKRLFIRFVEVALLLFAAILGGVAVSCIANAGDWLYGITIGAAALTCLGGGAFIFIHRERIERGIQ